MTERLSAQPRTIVVCAALVAASLVSTAGQTKITPPKTSYSIQEDIKLGQEAAAEARKELPMLNDERVDAYVEQIGARLVAAFPPEFQHPEFKYSFDVINQKEINAFALPGGPMFLNRGMIQAAKTEAEMAGVMAHEISHVALRHGTAQQGKSVGPGLLGAAGQILGGLFGGTAGALANLGSQIGAAAWMTSYSREFETQADLLGAQTLARAGYDPREMANMFKTIEAEGGGGGPQWLSSHPNPGNRYNAIVKEAQSLQVQGKADTAQFAQIKAHLDGMPPAYTAEQIAKGQAKTGNSPGNTAPTADGRTVVRVDPPSAQLRVEQPANFFRVGIPSNWASAGSQAGATYTPQGAYFQATNGRTTFTHGVQFGVTRGSGNLQRDTQSLLQSFAQGNPDLRMRGNLRRDSLSGRTALTGTLSNTSDVTGQPEVVLITTTTLPDGNTFYMIGVAPQSEAQAYDQAFRRVRQSIRFANAR
jgi:hypothetical protein